MESPAPERLPLPRWVTPLLTLVAIGLLPWTLWLTFSLPARHVSQHYDVAWAGFLSPGPAPRRAQRGGVAGFPPPPRPPLGATPRGRRPPLGLDRPARSRH